MRLSGDRTKRPAHHHHEGTTMTMPSLDAPDVDEQVEDLERVKQEALGQRDAIIGHTDDALALLSSVRLCAEQLAETHNIAMRRLDTIPGFDAELPEDASPYADLNLSATARALLGSFNADKLADLQAGLDSAQGAILRYRERVAADYERIHGEPVGWRDFYKQIGAAPAVSDALQLVIDDKCPVPGCGRETHGFVRVTDDGLEHLEKTPAALVTVEVYVRGESAVHLAGPSETGGTGPCICGFDRHAQGVGFSVGGGVTGPGVEHDVCAECAALVGDSTISGTHAALFRKEDARD